MENEIITLSGDKQSCYKSGEFCLMDNYLAEKAKFIAFSAILKNG